MTKQTGDRTTGTYVESISGGERVRAFVPDPLPPAPPFAIQGDLLALLGEADRAIGRLDTLSDVLPESHIFIYSYVRKEALLSSQIEGTQSSLSEILSHEHEADGAQGVPTEDVVEVSNYVAAMEHGLARLREEFPLSLRLFKEMHEKLLRSGRGGEKNPGEFRRTQNWIGGTRPGDAHFVPPPPQEVLNCMGALETFIHGEGAEMHPLLLAAVAHVQFETIHPFLDGNGRIGRLLITLLLCWRGVLRDPLLYLSLYFKLNRTEYYERLDRVRSKGEWEAWIRFFLEGVRDTARTSVWTARRVLELFQEDRTRLEGIGRAAGNAIRAHDVLKRRIIVGVPALARELGVSEPTAQRAIDNLENAGIAKEITGRKWGRQWSYARYLAILQEGTDPL